MPRAKRAAAAVRTAIRSWRGQDQNQDQDQDQDQEHGREREPMPLAAPEENLLVGREAELARFRDWVQEAVAGHGRAVLVEGEAGIGKSLLVRAGCAHAAVLGCQVFWGAGDELGRTFPLLPLLEGLRVRESAEDPRRRSIARLLRGELTAGSGVDLPVGVAEHLVALVEELCAQAPTVLVVDDLQWADQATLAVWGRLARSAADLPLLLVGITRPVPNQDDLTALREAVPPPDELRLEPLPEPAVVELVAALAGGTPGADLLRLADDAAGNPLYLTELVDALTRSDGLAVTAAGVAETTGKASPESLTAAIADRLGFLPDQVREVLRAAALLGVDFTVEDLAVVTRRRLGELLVALDDARAAGVLTAAGDGFAFRHPLIRAALYEEMPRAVRSAWHRDAGRALAAAGAPVDRVARQLLAAAEGSGDDATWVGEWAGPWLAGAAPLLIARAPGAAAELLRLAVAATPAGDPQHEPLACRLAEALYRVGDPAQAERVATRTLEFVTDGETLVDLLTTLTQCRAMAGRAAESLAALNKSLSFPGLTPGQRARLLVLIARTHRNVGEVDVADRIAAQALDEATRAGDHRTVGWALHVLTVVACMRGEVAEALPLFDRALNVTEGDPALADLRLLLQINHAAALSELDRYDQALAVARQVREAADRTGNMVRLVQAHSVLGELLFDTGRWDDALAAVTVLPDELKDPGVACCDHGTAAVIHQHRGEAVEAGAHLAAAAPAAERIGNRFVGSLALARSLHAEQAGAPKEALAALVAGIVSEAEETAEMEDLLPDAVRLAVEIGDAVTAAAVTGRVEGLSSAADVPHRSAAALYCRGLLDQDPDRILRAGDRYGDAGLPLARAKALEAAGAVLAAAGDAAGARAALTGARDVYAALGAGWDLARLLA
jgi:tetratricopeptide (TPR) repeat protein